MERLKSHRDFVSVLKLRQRVVSEDLIIQYAPITQVFPTEKKLCCTKTGNGDQTRRSANSDMHSDVCNNAPEYLASEYIHKRYLGLAVSVSVGNAVVRNHVKRQLRVLARRYEDILPTGIAVVIRPKPSIATTAFSSMDQQVHYLFKKISWRNTHPKPHANFKKNNSNKQQQQIVNSR